METISGAWMLETDGPISGAWMLETDGDNQ